MDILTQATLGAAIGEAVTGRQLGNRGIVWGAVLGLLPDTDILAEPFFEPVQQFLVHRSLTHSILFMVVMPPLITRLLGSLYRKAEISWKRWFVMVIGILTTHVLLDCLNNYGTLIFFPFSTYPVNLNSVFVVDPLYTIPLLIGVLTALFLKRTSWKRRWINRLGLILSSVYLIWAFFAKTYATEQFKDALQRQGINYTRLMTTPTPLNSLLWAGFAEHHDVLYVGLYSVLDNDDRIRFQKVPKNSWLLRHTSHELLMQRALWFSRGYYTIRQTEQGLRFYDVRFGRSDMWMGKKGNYVWGYRFDLSDDRKTITDFTRIDPQFNTSDQFLFRYWNRIWGK